MNSHPTYDVVIIGAGLGGLICGNILAQEGMKVCLLERNEQIGGSLQTFRRDGVNFDTGIHYIGGLGRGQTLYQIFDYLGLMERLEIKKLDTHGFDMILFKDDEVQYPHGMGYENFIDQLALHFPAERENIVMYCERIKYTCQQIPLYNLQGNDHYDDIDMMELSAKSEMEKITANEKLQAVLAGSNMLYAGMGDRTPWYVHALIVNSYIESSWRCTKTGEQIAKLLAKSIRAMGGTIMTKSAVKNIVEEGGVAIEVELMTSERIKGNKFISNLHPAVTMEMVNSPQIKPAYKSRIKSLQNSVSAFVLNIAMKPGMYKYSNRNYYYFNDEQVWDAVNYTEENFPITYGIFEAVPIKDPEHLEAVSIMTYMRWDEVKQWDDTVNNSVDPTDRGGEYEQFKQEKTEKLLKAVAVKFPDLVANIESWYASTPLTYRDYLNTPDGSIYGIVKDYNEPIRTLISPATKIPNLYLTGQNLKLHGVLGVSLSALVTCSAIIGREYLVNKIKTKDEMGA